MTTTAGHGIPTHSPHRSPAHRVLGKHPFGLLFSAPYLAFVAVVFAIPFVSSIWKTGTGSSISQSRSATASA